MDIEKLRHNFLIWPKPSIQEKVSRHYLRLAWEPTVGFIIKDASGHLTSTKEISEVARLIELESVSPGYCRNLLSGKGFPPEPTPNKQPVKVNICLSELELDL